MQFFLEGVHDRLHDDDVGHLLVLGRDRDPRSIGGVGAGDHPVDVFRIDVPAGGVPLVLLGELPGLLRVGLPVLEPLGLLLGGDLQPELEDDLTGVGDDLLEPVDLVGGTVVLLLGAEALDGLHQHPAVP